VKLVAITQLNLPRMFNKESIVVEAKNFLSKQLDIKPESIQGNAELKSLGLDSFRIIELVLFIERRTGMSFPDHAYTPSNLKTVESVAECFITLQK
jgi:acyl carrier protein